MLRRTSRRGALALLARISAFATAIPVIAVPLNVVQQPRPARDPDLERLIDRAKATPEWRAFRRSVISQDPVATARLPRSNARMLFFSLLDMSPEAVSQRRSGGFHLLEALLFVFLDSGSVHVAHVIPSADGGSSTLRDLATGELRRIEHSAKAKDQIEAARRAARSVREGLPQFAPVEGSSLKAAALTMTHCDCGPSDRYYCGSWTTVEGHIDHGCLVVCEIGCYLAGFNFWACLAGCNIGCWVPGYTYCSSYYCGPCLTA